MQQCFKTEREGEMINFLLMGDSRIRNIADFLENVVTNHSVPWFEKAHRHFNKNFPDANFNMDFLWGPLTEFHENREVYILKSTSAVQITVRLLVYIRLTSWCEYV